MRHPRASYANVMATLAVVVAVGGGAAAYAVAAADTTVINGCVKKPGTPNAGIIHIVDDLATCTVNEYALSWNMEGPQGPPGSPDTPQQVLDKIVQVDGQGSGLDSSFLDGIDSTGFLRSTGKAVDADKLDGLNSTSFVKRGTVGNGVIGLSSIGAHKCSDVTLGLGGVRVGDIILMNVQAGDALPAGLTMTGLDVPVNGQFHMRMCNSTATASPADNDIKLRWYALRP